MRKITSLLMLCLMAFGLTAYAQTATKNWEIPVTDLSQLSNDAKYFIQSQRCFLLYDATIGQKLGTSNAKLLNSNKPVKDVTNNNQLFEIRNEGGKRYLYSVGAGKYVTSNGSFSDTPSGELTFSTGSASYPWLLCIGGNGMNSQDPNQMDAGIVVNDWTTKDAGNCYQICAIEETMSHDGWTVTAFNEAGTYGNEGGISFVQDENPSTFYHSDYSNAYADGTSSKQKGQDGVQGFMIELPASCDISKLSYTGRSDNGNNWATQVRVYIYETLPDGITTNLSSYSFSEKEAKFGKESTLLGTPAFENSASPWAADRTQKNIEFATPKTGKYILFLADATTHTNGYLTCSYFNITGEYKEALPTPIVLDNSKAYLLHNPNGHGYLMYAPAKSEDNVWVSGEEGKSHANFEVQAVDKTSANFYWQIITHNDKTYLYNVGAQKFVTTGGPCKLVGTPTPINMTALADIDAYAFNSGTGDYGFMCASEHQGHYVSAPVQFWSSDDAGAKWVVEENETLVDFDNTTALVMIQNYEGALTAEGILASYDGVGYPVDSERELLATAAANSKADFKSTANLAALAAAAESYKSTSDVKMPENGKAYTFKNVQKDGTAQYFKYDEANGITLTSDAASASTFICRANGDKFTFVTTDGKYLAVKGNNNFNGPNSNKGYTNEYDQTAGKFLNDFIVTKMTPSNVATDGNSDAIAVTNELLFGYVGIATQRHDRDQLVYYVLTKTGGFDQASAPFCRHNLTSMLRIDEVEYPNKPVVNDAAGVEGVAAISTFCAPFATVAPNNVDVYIAASDESHYIKLQKVEGAVPANTGVVLVSTEDAQVGQAVTMVPATTETLADVTGNLLRGDAAKADYTVDAAVNAYVLGAVDGVAGFYPLSATDRTIKQGKAYLELDAVLSAVKLYFGGDDATGIETVVKENANAPIFDLSGRRVVNVAKGGIYIQNGKKFIVK